jgi:hypothetical protein
MNPIVCDLSASTTYIHKCVFVLRSPKGRNIMKDEHLIIDTGLSDIELGLELAEIRIDELEILAASGLARAQWLNRHWNDLEGLQT